MQAIYNYSLQPTARKARAAAERCVRHTRISTGMKRTLVLFGIALICNACLPFSRSIRSVSVGPLALGGPIPRSANPLGITHKGGLLCSQAISISGIDFNFDSECGHDRVVYIQTHDARFRTPEGISVGVSLANALKLKGSRLLKDDYDSCGVVLRTGWIARPNLSPEDKCVNHLDAPIAYFDSKYIGPL